MPELPPAIVVRVNSGKRKIRLTPVRVKPRRVNLLYLLVIAHPRSCVRHSILPRCPTSAVLSVVRVMLLLRPIIYNYVICDNSLSAVNSTLSICALIMFHVSRKTDTKTAISLDSTLDNRPVLVCSLVIARSPLSGCVQVIAGQPDVWPSFLLVILSSRW